MIKEETSSYTIVYLYDANGAPIAFQVRSNTYNSGVWDFYIYEKNLLGDIVAIYDSNGNKVYTYSYNAWGVVTRTQETSMPTTAYVNALTYRGYYYDWDLELYYLQSRYYDPNTCRFINADGYVSTGQGLTGYNMFAYCGNNPVMRVDPNGERFYSNTMVSLRVDGGSSTVEGDFNINFVIQFSFEKNKEFNILTSPSYANELYKSGLPINRTYEGILIELNAHYIVHKIDVFDLTDRDDLADMGSYQRDANAQAWEFLGYVYITIYKFLWEE